MRHFRSSPGDARLREIASKNRACYKRLRKELEELTDHGLRMLKSLQRPGANIMQRLAVRFFSFLTADCLPFKSQLIVDIFKAD